MVVPLVLLLGHVVALNVRNSILFVIHWKRNRAIQSYEKEEEDEVEHTENFFSMGFDICQM